MRSGAFGVLAVVLVGFSAAVHAQELAPTPPPQAVEPAPPAPPPPPPPSRGHDAPDFGPFFPDSAPEADDLTPLATDSLAPRESPAETLARYRADPDFQYDRPRSERPSLLQRFLDWLGRTFFAPLFAGLATDGGRYLLIALLVVLLGWAVTRLLRADMGPLFARRDVDAATAGPLLDVEEIAEVDLDALLEEALGRNDFREAVRFRYLLALQTLDLHGAIRWSRHKTNREYVREAREAGGPALADPFADTTRVFDWVWYGERPVDRDRYARLGPLFERLDTALADLRRPAASAR